MVIVVVVAVVVIVLALPFCRTLSTASIDPVPAGAAFRRVGQPLVIIVIVIIVAQPCSPPHSLSLSRRHPLSPPPPVSIHRCRLFNPVQEKSPWQGTGACNARHVAAI